MTRYFYTDPLAAAWMAKHHGMKFEGGDSYISAIEAAHTMDVLERIPFYIHPDSVSLLKPKIGDHIYRHHNYYCVLSVAEHKGLQSTFAFQNQTMPIKTVLGWKHPENTHIVLRKHVPFHWPESEDSPLA